MVQKKSKICSQKAQSDRGLDKQCGGILGFFRPFNSISVILCWCVFRRYIYTVLVS